MSLTRCRYCEHGNPADSKFCSACGGALFLPPYLASCPRCGTVNPVKATACSWCQVQLPGRRTGALVLSSLAAKVSRFLLQRPSRVVVGTAVLGAMGVLGYYIYRQGLPDDAPQARAASSEASGGGADAGDAKSAKAEQPLRAGGQPVESQEAKAAAAAIARPQTINAGRGSERGPIRPEACTEAVAALGLCAAKPVQKKEAEAAAAEAVKRPRTAGTGKAGGQEPPQPCTEAVAALGLCTPQTTQRRE